MTQPKDVFQGLSAPRAIAKFAIPTVLSQMVTLLYNLADTFLWDIPTIPHRWPL